MLLLSPVRDWLIYMLDHPPAVQLATSGLWNFQVYSLPEATGGRLDNNRIPAVCEDSQSGLQIISSIILTVNQSFREVYEKQNLSLKNNSKIIAWLYFKWLPNIIYDNWWRSVCTLISTLIITCSRLYSVACTAAVPGTDWDGQSDSVVCAPGGAWPGWQHSTLRVWDHCTLSPQVLFSVLSWYP